MPDISIIIPAYNHAGLIGETLRSLLNQTVLAKEIIVVDDGSTDGTAEKTLEAFENWKPEKRWQGAVFSKIQLPILEILRQVNAGTGAAKNRDWLAQTT
jgi:glycosyltransferase involved in cell wall biosynthesis